MKINITYDYNAMLEMPCSAMCKETCRKEWGHSFEHAKSRLITRIGLEELVKVPEDEEVELPIKSALDAYNEINEIPCTKGTRDGLDNLTINK